MATCEPGLKWSAMVQMIHRPNDLRIMIISDSVEGEGAEIRRYGFQVFRGPRGDGRHLVTWPPFAASREDLIEFVYRLFVHLAGLTLLGLAKMREVYGYTFGLVQDSVPLDKILQTAHAEWIHDQLLKLDPSSGPQTVSTHEMPLVSK